MWCRECGGEYRPGIVTCPTCEVALVESLDPDPAATGHSPGGAATGTVGVERTSFVGLASFATIEEARAAKARLQEADIPARIMINDVESEAEEIWILVPEAAHGVAEQLIAMRDPLSEELCNTCQGPFNEDGVCPKCAS